MPEHDMEKPPGYVPMIKKASWAIRQALRENPEGMSTPELVASVRNHWPDEFDGERGEFTVRSAQIFLKKKGLIVKATHA